MKPGIDFIAHHAAEAPTPRGQERPWWEGRPFVAALILAAFIPLLYPGVPPLVDMGGHMGRYYVAAEQGHNATLAQWFHFQWLPIGNLGVDLLVIPLAKLIGVEPATKLVVMCIPPLTVAGMLWVSREVHNRLPPTAAFALPLAFCHPFLFGFVNYALSIALAFLAFGLWLRLGRLGKTKLRAVLMVPISFIVFFSHTFGWGVLGLLCFSADAVRQHDKGRSWFVAGLRAAYHSLALALPVLLILLWRVEATGGVTKQWFFWYFKAEFLRRILRDRWEVYDTISAALLGCVILFAMLHPRLTLSRNLLFSAIVLTVVYILLPRMIFGSAFADMRMAPYLVAIFVLAVRFEGPTDMKLARYLAIAALLFFSVRIAGNTVSLAMAWNKQVQQLRAVDHIDRGSKVAILIWNRCLVWPQHRTNHIGSLALIRRDAFTNDQWPMVGSSLMTINYPEAGIFQRDPSEIVRDNDCKREGWSVETAFHYLPRQAFDYLWLLDMRPLDPKLLEGWTPVFMSPDSKLYRRSDAAAPPQATPQTASAPAR